MDMKLKGKTALITGGSKGIGLAAAESFLAEGCNVILVARNKDELAKASEQLNAIGPKVKTITADLSKSEEVDRVGREAGDIDILVNNAGAVPPGKLVDLDAKSWRAGWDLKLFGYIDLSRIFYAKMTARGGGVIVNVIGVSGEDNIPGYIAGSTGNAGLMAFTRTLGKLSCKDGIRVVGINPGPVRTERNEMMRRFRAKELTGDEERFREQYAVMPFGRPAHPAEIGDAVVFLASERSGYTTGTILTIHGGGVYGY